MATETKGKQGKSANQKLKTYLVMQYLLRNTDERNPATMEDIRSYLKECGIESERRSIYRDIEDINKILYMLDQQAEDEECTIEDAEDAFANEDYIQDVKRQLTAARGNATRSAPTAS